MLKLIHKERIHLLPIELSKFKIKQTKHPWFNCRGNPLWLPLSHK